MGNILKYAFRITHIDNIPHIARYGLVKSDSVNRNENYVNIGDSQIIQIRSKIPVKGYRISDYIPFYLGPRSPMLYVIQHGYNGVKRIEPEKIVYCIVRLDDIIAKDIDCIFTDGHALSVLTKFYGKEHLPRISEIVKAEDVYSNFWNSETDIDLKRRKEAELLVKTDLPPAFIRGYIVYNEAARLELLKFGISEDLILVSRNQYF